jgi:hypothetical protein
MSTSKLALAVLFLVGCVAGAAGSQLIAPSARAGGNPTRWEYFCVQGSNDQRAMGALNDAGSNGFELVSATFVSEFNQANYCMKRPLP